MHTDPIADMLTRIRNAGKAGHKTVSFGFSGVKFSIAEILKKFGFVQKARSVKRGKFEEIEVTLDPERQSMVLTRMSTPGRRRYLSSSEIRPIRNGYGIGIISTSHGVMTTKEAKEKGIGGEYICEVY